MLEPHHDSSVDTDSKSEGGKAPSFFGGRRIELREAPAPLSAGQSIAGFRLVELIGEGGMGQVWRAEQGSVNRSVALKLVRPELVTEKSLELFAREARAGARLRHPGIVDVIDHGTSGGIAWIAMELIDGAWTLRDFLNDLSSEGKVPETYYRDAAHFIALVADAMGAVHDSGVIHRDLKPQNILIAPDDTPRVTDFGLARITSELALSMTGEVMGTYLYMSPEQVKGTRASIDHRTDIFSLGIVFYEMLTGRRPFEGDTSLQVTTEILDRDPPDMRALRSRIPLDLATITCKCLEKEQERRYPSMADLASDLRRHLKHQPIQAKPPGRLRKAWLWVRRNPAKSLAASIAVLAFGAISTLYLENLRTNRELSKQKVTAERAAAAERARADEVLRLSALPDYESLVAEADQLWPAHPDKIAQLRDWIAKMTRLTDELPSHRARLAELSAMALPQSDEERAAERRAHPSFPRLELVEGQILARSRELARAKGGRDPELPALSDADLALSSQEANAKAWPLVDPAREVMGHEPRGLALAQRSMFLAVQIGDTQLQAQVGGTVAWGFFALGRYQEAEAASALTLELAPERVKEIHRGYLKALRTEVGHRVNEAGFAAAEDLIETLKRERSDLIARVNERQSWRYPETKEGASAGWWRSNLAKLITALETSQDPRAGLLSAKAGAISPQHGWSMPRRLWVARRMRERQEGGGRHARLWEEAIDGIRSDERYGGIELPPQVGLVPIGTDPVSGLWEFYHEATGVEPTRDAAGTLSTSAQTGVVLVLLPGCKFWMGSNADAWANHNPDPQAEHDEGPVHEVELSPYFLSKYELTQGQWLHMVEPNPSLHKLGDLTHPVENVSWEGARQGLFRMGLVLPSEAQWENGCRGGTSSPWWTGEERRSLQSELAANLADQAAARAGDSWPAISNWPELDDGHAKHAPVGTYAANPFGLHDVHGNVSEWCLDGFEVSYYGKSELNDPVSVYFGRLGRTVRGGGFTDPAAEARAANRRRMAPTQTAEDVGIRPARAIDW